jgi:hypothetical protein
MFQDFSGSVDNEPARAVGGRELQLWEPGNSGNWEDRVVVGVFPPAAAGDHPPPHSSVQFQF